MLGFVCLKAEKVLIFALTLLYIELTRKVFYNVHIEKPRIMRK